MGEESGASTRFATAGDPNGGGALPWFVYGQNPDNFLHLEIPLAEGAGFHAGVCDSFWDPPAYGNQITATGILR
jgi:hypothetical protein